MLDRRLAGEDRANEEDRANGEKAARSDGVAASTLARFGDALEAGPTTSEQLGLGSELPFTLADRIGLMVERVDELRERPLLIGGLLAAVLALAVLVPRLVASPPGPPIEDRIPQVTLTPTTAVAGAVTVIVHVSGAVRMPGVYTLDVSARVVDAVDAAGGATVDAQLHQLNLAALVTDGQQIWVPVVGETVMAPVVAAVEGPVDLNRADAIALQELPGVGPATAEAIVAYREASGPFRSVDDLLDVPGIGPAKLAAIADAVVVR